MKKKIKDLTIEEFILRSGGCLNNECCENCAYSYKRTELKDQCTPFCRAVNELTVNYDKLFEEVEVEPITDDFKLTL